MKKKARLPYLKPSEMDGKLRVFYDDVIRELDRPGMPHITKLTEGQMIGPFTSMFNFPEYGESLYRLQVRLLKQCVIPNHICELVILVIACSEDAAYAVYAHELLAERAGLPEPVIEAIKTGREPALETAEEKTAYALATELARPGPVSDEIYEKALAAFGAEGLNTLINTAALFKYLSTLMNAYDEPIPEALER